MGVIEWPIRLPNVVAIAMLEVGVAHAYAVLVRLKDQDGTVAEAGFDRAMDTLANTIVAAYVEAAR